MSKELTPKFKINDEVYLLNKVDGFEIRRAKIQSITFFENDYSYNLDVYGCSIYSKTIRCEKENTLLNEDDVRKELEKWLKKRY